MFDARRWYNLQWKGNDFSVMEGLSMRHIELTVDEHIATITLNRPKQLNAFSEDMLRGWIEALEQVRDDDDIRVCIVTGSGKAFCAGGDIKAMAAGKGFYDSEQDISTTALARKNSLWKLVQRIPLLLQEIDKPVIAKVNGFAMGAGFDMALMCDIRIACSSATMSESYVNVGIVPGDGGAYFLPKLIGKDRALDLLWTARILTAQQAYDLGLVTFVVEENELDHFTHKKKKKLAAGPQVAIRMMKRAVYDSERLDLRTALDLISSQMGIVTEHDDFTEGVQAIIEKRKPNFE